MGKLSYGSPFLFILIVLSFGFGGFALHYLYCKENLLMFQILSYFQKPNFMQFPIIKQNGDQLVNNISIIDG